MNTNSYGSSAVFKWTKEYLVQLMTSGKDPIITDPLLINALQKIDRKDFVPRLLESQAYSDVELDIGYGEKLNKPTIIAQMLSYLKPKYGGRYLDLGTGTAYVAGVLGFVSGDTGKVFSIERVQWLWEQARTNIQKYKELSNVQLIYRDGVEGLVNQAPFDGIHIGFSLEEIPEKLKLQLRVGGGRLVCPTNDNYLRVIERKTIEEFEEERIPGFMIDKVKDGMA